MKNIVLIFTFLLFGSSFATGKKNHKDKKPIAKLKVSQKKCESPCTVTLDGSKSKAAKDKTIAKYIFDLGNGETIESTTPSIEFTYINFKEETDKEKRKKRLKKYKKWKKYIKYCKRRFKNFDKFKIKLQVVQSDDKTSKSKKKLLFVKPSDSMPVIDGDDIIPPMPNKEENDSTLLGVDSDGDGVRDDVELWINRDVDQSPEVRKAFKQMSKGFQLALSEADDKVKSINNSNKIGEALTCAAERGGKEDQDFNRFDRLEKNHRSLLMNTKERILANIRYNNQLVGKGAPPRVLEIENQGRSLIELCE
jgi:hypothetical protein